MVTMTPDGRQLISKDFWVAKNASPPTVLAESYHLLLMNTKFITFASQSLQDPNLPPNEAQDIMRILTNHVESVNNVMQAVDYYLNIKVRPAARKQSE